MHLQGGFASLFLGLACVEQELVGGGRASHWCTQQLAV